MLTMMTRKGKARLKRSQTSMVLIVAVGGRLYDMNEVERHFQESRRKKTIKRWVKVTKFHFGKFQDQYCGKGH